MGKARHLLCQSSICTQREILPLPRLVTVLLIDLLLTGVGLGGSECSCQLEESGALDDSAPMAGDNGLEDTGQHDFHLPLSSGRGGRLG